MSAKVLRATWSAFSCEIAPCYLISMAASVVQASAMADEEGYGSQTAVAFVLKELLTICPQLCDPGTCTAWQRL